MFKYLCYIWIFYLEVEFDINFSGLHLYVTCMLSLFLPTFSPSPSSIIISSYMSHSYTRTLSFSHSFSPHFRLCKARLEWLWLARIREIIWTGWWLSLISITSKKEMLRWETKFIVHMHWCIYVLHNFFICIDNYVFFFIHSLIQLFVYSFIHSFIHSFD